MSEMKQLIEEAWQSLLSMDYASAYQYGLVGRLADALEESERERDGALLAMNTHSCGESAEAAYRRTLKAEAERDALAATLERVRAVEPFRFPDADDPERNLGDLALWKSEVDAALDSAPLVARPLPDREALAQLLFVNQSDDRKYLREHLAQVWDSPEVKGEDFRAVETRVAVATAYRQADAVLAAIEKGGE